MIAKKVILFLIFNFFDNKLYYVSIILQLVYYNKKSR